MISIPVPEWLFITIMIIGGIGWAFEILVLKPKRRRERIARKKNL